MKIHYSFRQFTVILGLFFLLGSVLFSEEDYTRPFFKYAEPRTARVRFVVNGEGRAENPEIIENETNLPEAAVLLELGHMVFAKSMAGREIGTQVMIQGEMGLAEIMSPRPTAMKDGRRIYAQDEVDTPVPDMSQFRDSMMDGGEPTHWYGKEPALVMVRFIITEKGKIENMEVIYASHEAAGPIALRTFRRYKFKPAIKDGKPVCSYYDMAWAFRGRR
ncbi:MAG: energy transducer TonB [Opitutaceae bacterium]|nr:energy transducer TonB [Opitutaceae bacterium]MBP9911909.1 energy transducer TonB [Opitutaceae bacterium]